MEGTSLGHDESNPVFWFMIWTVDKESSVQKPRASGFCLRASEFFWEIQITEELKSMLNKNFNSQVEMTFGEAHASYSIPKWQAVKLTFFAPWWVSKLMKFISLRLPFLFRQENKKQSRKLSREMSKWNLPDVRQNPSCGQTQWPDRSNI